MERSDNPRWMFQICLEDLKERLMISLIIDDHCWDVCLVQIIKRKLHKIPIIAAWWNRMKHFTRGGTREKVTSGNVKRENCIERYPRNASLMGFLCLKWFTIGFFRPLSRKWPICLYSFDTRILHIFHMYPVYKRMNEWR